MRVGDWMSADPVIVAPATEVGEARRLMHEGGFRHLPVVDGGRLVGIVSDRDVRIDERALERALSRLTDVSVVVLAEAAGDERPVSQVMSRSPHVVDEADPIEAAARLMLSRRISALPVVDGDRGLVGVVTTTDCLLAALEAGGSGNRADRVDRTMPAEPTGLVALTTEQCVRLLHEQPVKVGRVGITDDQGRPLVIPVNYCMDADGVVFRTAPGSLLATRAAGRRIAFEADDVDVALQDGWSVLVDGVAQTVTDVVELARLRRLRLRAWAPGDRSLYLRIDPVQITGRQIT